MRETGISSGGGSSSPSSGGSHPQQAAVGDEPCGSCRSSSFGRKCSHAVKKQRAKFYIVRRCIAMLVCWRDRGDS